LDVSLAKLICGNVLWIDMMMLGEFMEDQSLFQFRRQRRPCWVFEGFKLIGAVVEVVMVSISSEANTQSPIKGPDECLRKGRENRKLLRVVASIQTRIMNVLGVPVCLPLPEILRLIANERLIIGAKGFIQAIEGALQGIAPAKNGYEAQLENVQVVLVHVCLRRVRDDLSWRRWEDHRKMTRVPKEKPSEIAIRVVRNFRQHNNGVSQFEGRGPKLNPPAPAPQRAREIVQRRLPERRQGWWEL